MFCGVIDVPTGKLDYCQAAYPAAFYMDSCGDVHAIGDGGFPVGMLSGLTYETNSVTIDIGGSLVVCSDAACEAENLRNTPFGLDRLKSIVS